MPKIKKVIRYNEELISLFGKLEELMMMKGEPFRARAYKKAKEAIMLFPDNITDGEQLREIRGIGDAVINKTNEYIKTGTVKALEKEKENPIYIFTQVYGIGPKKAKELVQKNKITSIKELREKQDELLNDKQKIGLKHYEDIQERIPRKEIDKFKKVIDKVFSSVKNDTSSYEIVGSYRRGAKDSGDIDIIITDEHNDEMVYELLLNELSDKGIITDFLSRGDKKSLVVGKLPDTKKTKYKHRRIDFLFTPIQEFPFALLYFTGSAAFNTAMRQVALNKNLTMNEHGINHMKDKTKGDKVDILFKNEKDIFSFLNMEYKKPDERIDSRSIVFVSDKMTNFKITGKITKIKKSQIKNTKIGKPHKSQTKHDDKDDYGSGGEDDGVDAIDVKPIKKLTKTQCRNHLKKFMETGIDYIEALSQSIVEQLLRYANEDYYNNKDANKVLLSDEQFDILKEYIERTYPDAFVLKEIGAPIAKEEKVKLPYFMGSMDKIKPDSGALSNWKKKYTNKKVLSVKLDGVSGLYTTELSDTGTNVESDKDKTKTPRLFTRGDGVYGQDITHILHFMELPKLPNVTVRGEFIVKKDVFTKHLSKEFANTRNFVSGIINSKKGKQEYYKYIDFVAYEVIKPELKASAQFEFLRENGFTVAKNETVSHSKLTNELLSDRLVDWRTNYQYDIDGVIVTDDKIHPRVDGNPKHSFAFKMVLSDQVAEAKVVDVLWEPSEYGYLKPRVRIEPIHLVGVKIEYATGHNAKFVEDNKIGVGAVIEIIRSGDVIPKIEKVIKPSSKAKMPTVDYEWNDTHVDIILKDLEKNFTVQKKKIVSFMKNMSIDGVSDGTIKRFMESGKTTLKEILNMSIDDIMEIDGFKKRSATKIYENIHSKLDSAPITDFMNASGAFGRGFGVKKLTALLTNYPDVLITTETQSQIITKIVDIPGFSTKSAEKVAISIQNFRNFMIDLGLEDKINGAVDSFKKSVSAGIKAHPLFGKKIVMTGFRDKELETKLKEFGVNISGSVSKNTDFVLVKSLDEDTAKAEKAKALGIELVVVDEFKVKYKL
jgi:NAD-dependent DNA ligase/DNA polymerase/3'-5' exonuclease PolX